MNEYEMSAQEPTMTLADAARARRGIPSGLRRTIATIVLSAGLFAVGGVAVVSAASPTPSASTAPSGSGGPGTPGAGGTHTGANCPGM
jgi:hypothetical protein